MKGQAQRSMLLLVIQKYSAAKRNVVVRAMWLFIQSQHF